MAKDEPQHVRSLPPSGHLIVRAAEVVTAGSASARENPQARRPAAAPGPTPAAAAAPGSAAPKSPPKPAPRKAPTTILGLVEEWSRVDRLSTINVLWLGWIAYAYVRRQADRPAAVREIREALRAAGFRGETARVNRMIGCYWVAKLFGPDQARHTGATILRSLIPLLKRDPETEQWEIRAQCHDGALVLWRRIAAEHLNAAAVQLVVQQLRPPRIAQARRARSLTREIMRRVAKLTPDELADVARQIQARLAVVGSAAA